MIQVPLMVQQQVDILKVKRVGILIGIQEILFIPRRRLRLWILSEKKFEIVVVRLLMT